MTNEKKLKQISVEEFIKLFCSKPTNEVLPYFICIWLRKCDFCILNGKCIKTIADSPEYYPANCIDGIKKYLESEVKR